MKEEDLLIFTKSVQNELQLADSVSALNEVKIRFLGKNGHLSRLLRDISSLPKSDRPRFGGLLNKIKQDIESLLAVKIEKITNENLLKKIEIERVDVTLPGRKSCNLGAIHPISRVMFEVSRIFVSLGFEFAEGFEIEDEYHNFEALNMPEFHPARAMQDTFYINSSNLNANNFLLRTHTSCVQIRHMEKYGVPVRMVCAGSVYRKDMDSTHTPMFHQLEGLVVDKSCSFSDLKWIIKEFLSVFFNQNDLQLRFRPSFFPFTEPSAEVDIYNKKNNSWLEVLGCGMVHPNVLNNVGVDHSVYQGYAFGVGLERLAMLKYGISDIRLFFENDLSFLLQFLGTM